MATLRRATVDDAALIAQHRHSMFADNHFTTEARLSEMDRAFEPWVRTHLAAGTYIGLLLIGNEGGEQDKVLAGAGIFLMEFPPHWMHNEALRAYLLNFYTAPEARGRGYAKWLVRASIDAARERGATVITLHASPFGKPIYEKLGFQPSSEMLLRTQT